MPKRDDPALMEAIRRREAVGLEHLYDRHAPSVLALCQRIVGNRADAEEVLEEVFWEIWRRAERYDAQRASPLVYLLTVARSRSIDRIRQRRRRPESGADPLEFVGPGATAGDAEPFVAAAHAERRRLVRKALQRLEPQERVALELSFFQGLTHREISARLEEPLGTTKTRIRRGLLRLRAVLRELGNGAEAA